LPTVLGKAYDHFWRGRPPGMMDVDVPVWWRFFDKWGWQFERFYYDTTLGGPLYTQEAMKDPLMKMWQRTLSKRADAIAESKTEVWIIEVTGSAGLRALGQLMTYRALWLRDPVIMKPERLALVAEVADPDTADAASMYGVMVFIMPP